MTAKAPAGMARGSYRSIGKTYDGVSVIAAKTKPKHFTPNQIRAVIERVLGEQPEFLDTFAPGEHEPSPSVRFAAEASPPAASPRRERAPDPAPPSAESAAPKRQRTRPGDSED